MPDVQVAEVPERERYELTVDGEVAGFSDFRGGGVLRAVTHTEIDPRFEGQGLGSILVKAVLDDVRTRGMHVLPVCPFVKAYLAQHPEELDLVEVQHRRAFHLPEPA
jgi:predicted GNAT family acetyltransferase